VLSLYLKLAAIAALFGLFTWYTFHERNVQKAKDIAADVALTQAQIINNQKVEALAQSKADAAIAVFKAELAAAPAPDAPHLLCTRSRPAPGPVPANGGAGSSADAKTHVPETGPGTNEPAIVTIDLGPQLDKLLEDADAEITVDQAYIQACIDAKICKAP
jgi:hypothetical protein